MWRNAVEGATEFLARTDQVVVRLVVDPELRCGTKVARQQQCGTRCDGTGTVHDFIDLARLSAAHSMPAPARSDLSAYTPLVVDTDTVLPLTIAGQRLGSGFEAGWIIVTCRPGSGGRP